MHPRRSGSSPLLMSTPLLILLLLIFSLAFIFFALSSLNKTWDSFNIFLVLFAMILCVVFARQNDDESCTSYQQHAFTAAVLAPSDAYANLRITEEEGGYVSHQWFGFSLYESEEGMGNICYHTPPIRLQPLATDHVTVNHRTRPAGVVEEEEDNVKEIPVDNFENRSPTPPPPLPKSPAPLPPTPPPSPPPPQPANAESEDRSRESEKIKSSVKKEIAMVWASVLSNQKKRKKQERKKAILNHDSDNLLHTLSELPNNTRAPPPPSPPLPPPPPPSVFRSLLKKGRLCRGNKVHSVSAPTPRRRKTMPAVNTCNQLPLMPVPPPPPLAFELLAMEDVDVDVKAAAFIARLKDEWKLEKLKSMKERANFSRPCLGPGPFPLRGFNL